MELRWYQRESVDEAYKYLCSEAGNPVICLPTGSGKSWVIAELARRAVKDWSGRVLILQHRKELIEQNAEKVRALLDIPIGEYSAGLRRYGTEEDIVLCGIQSVYDKATLFDRRHLVIIDEVHLVPTDSEGMFHQFLADCSAVNPGLRVVGLTATPFRTGEGPICRPNGIFQKLCYSADVKALIEEGFLCKVTNRPSTTHFDTSGLHMRYGEFINRELETLFGGTQVAEACREIVEKTADRKSVMVFCSSLRHAGSVASTIEKLTGETVDVIEGGTSPLERAAILSGFKSGTVRWLVNVDVLCLDEETEILCKDGWCSIDEMHQEKLVASWHMDGSITFDNPKMIVRRPLQEGEVFVKLKSNAVDVRVTGNHRMIVGFGENPVGNWKIKKAIDLIGKKVTMPAHGFAVPFEFKIEQEQVDRKKQLARTRALSYVYKNRYGLDSRSAKEMAIAEQSRKMNFRKKAPSELSIDECMLIGFWIGDGSKSNGRFSIAQSEAYPDNIDFIDKLLERTGIQHSRIRRKPAIKTKNHSILWTLARGTGSCEQARVGFFQIEDYLNKDGSDLLWGLGKKQFRALLYGWWLADGVHHGKHRNEMRVSCINKKLIDKLQAIATCRGIRTSVRTCSKPNNENHKQQWTMSWCEARSISVVKNRFEVEQPNPKERVWCVTSSTGNIITRRNGKVCVMGNTTGFDAPNVDAICILRATASPGLFAQIVGRGLRTHPSKQDCLVLDFGQNIERHGSIDDIDFGRIRTKSKREQDDDDQPEGRECPNCDGIIPKKERICECGFQFPHREPNHEQYADTQAAILSNDEPEDHEVLGAAASRHDKEGKLPSMRITYDVGGNLPYGISEWICIEHAGFARSKAELWWKEHCSLPCPDSIDEAIDLFRRGWVAIPRQITTKREGRFKKIVAREIEEIPVGLQENEVVEELPF